MDRMLRFLKKNFSNFSPSEQRFFGWAVFCSFLISIGYAVVRPVSDTIFITAYGSQLFPYAWLATIPLNFMLVSLYHVLLPKHGCWKIFLGTIGAIGLINLLAAVFLSKVFVFPFFFYLWKEIFILLLFQQLWSVIHSTVSPEKAKYFYGPLFAIGSIGSILGSTIPGFCAVKAGSANLLFFAFPLYALLTFTYRNLLQKSEIEKVNFSQSDTTPFKEGWQAIGRSKALVFILLIVVLMQVLSTLTYYQFNTVLEKTIGDQDLRTEYVGRVGGVISTLSLALQVFGAPLLVHYMGLRRSHLTIPCILGCNTIASLLYPTFGVVSYSYTMIKSFDFSLFSVLKEMLYVPLSSKEKFQAKAVIDIFAYRTAKAGASFLILLFQWMQGWNLTLLLSSGSLILFAFWVLITRRFLLDSSYDRR